MNNIAVVMYMGPTGLGILRSLGKQGISAYGLDWNPDALGFYSKFCKRNFIFPNPMEDPDRFISKLIELNPRFWQQNIQATDAGINFPYINYMDCLGMKVEPCLSFKNGVRWLDFWADARSFRAHSRKDGMSIISWLPSVLKARSFSNYASNDLRPFFIKLSAMLKYYLNKILNPSYIMTCTVLLPTSAKQLLTRSLACCRACRNQQGITNIYV